jgi:hypothetical protein
MRVAAVVRNMLLTIVSCLTLTTVTPVALGEEERPAIVRIDLYVANGQLTGDIATRGLFPERIVGTVQSGLPSVVELFYHLMESGGGSFERGVHSFSLQYDVWNDAYSVTWQDSTVSLPSLEAMRSMIEQMRGITLVPVDRMLPDHSYQVEMSVAVSPLQGTDKRKMAGWIRENVGGRTEDSWHEQLLNVNDLITHFFSSEEESPMRSEWFRSPIFRPDLLPSHESEEG